ncbi:hypothetical protein J2W97_000803 [Paenibacillus jamilae]|jgi:hypothetical protein|nr:hypothetical protein [Paenibacillus jamilae]
MNNGKLETVDDILEWYRGGNKNTEGDSVNVKR